MIVQNIQKKEDKIVIFVNFKNGFAREHLV